MVMMNGLWKPPVLLLASALLLLLPAGIAGQEIRGLVAEPDSLDPVQQAVVTLFRVTDGTGDLIPVASAPSGPDGAFALQGDGAGVYRVQATHFDLSSLLSPEMGMAPGQVETDVSLLVPSRHLMLAQSCPETSLQAGGAVVAGVIRDGLSKIPLSGARVVVRWQGPDGSEEMAVQSDAGGRYLLCGVPAGGFLQFRGELLGQTGEWEELEVGRPALVLHDVEMTLGTTARIAPPGERMVQERILMESAARGLGDLRGQLLDAESGRPIPQAAIRLGDGRQQRVTDEDGQFAFHALQPGRYLLEIAHLGYSVQSDEVKVPGGGDVFVRLRVSQQGMELEGIEVEVRGAAAGFQRLTPFRSITPRR